MMTVWNARVFGNILGLGRKCIGRKDQWNITTLNNVRNVMVLFQLRNKRFEHMEKLLEKWNGLSEGKIKKC